MSLQQRDCSGFSPDSLFITNSGNCVVNQCGAKIQKNFGLGRKYFCLSGRKQKYNTDLY